MLKRLSIVAVGVVLASNPVAASNLRANQKATGFLFGDTKEAHDAHVAATQTAHDASVAKLNDAISSLQSKYEALNTERNAFETESAAKQATWSTKIQEMQNKLTNDEKTFRDNEAEILEAFQKAQEVAQEEAQAKIDAEMQAASAAFTKKEATRLGEYEAATTKAHEAMGAMPFPEPDRHAFDEYLHTKMMALND